MTASDVHVEPDHPTRKRFRRWLKFALLAAVLFPLFTETARGQTEVDGVLVLSADFELRRYNVHGIIEPRPEETAAACRCLTEFLVAD